VKGTVTVDGTALFAGQVTYYPDSAKGNTSRFIPIGGIDAQGNYTLTTDGREGAPPGWYKVTVIGGSQSDPRQPPPPKDAPPPPKAEVNSVYSKPNSTTLLIEVRENAPGSYDLKLSKAPRGTF
jgi:hypothetical protein